MTFDETLVLAMKKINAFVAERREEFEADMQAAGADMEKIYAMLEKREPEMLAEIEQQIRAELARIYSAAEREDATLQ
jgi:hypothetical protein